MAAPSYYVQTPDGKKVPFDVPEGADAEQVRTLAARALKQAAPDTEYQRPVLSRDTASSLGIAYKLEPDRAPPAPPDLSKQGSISTYEPSLAERMADKIGGALSGLGVNDRYARHVGERTSGALADLTPVGAATEADLAKTAFGHGNYIGALGHGLGSALSAIPEGGAAKAMFLGVLAKNADKAALRRAEEMVAAGADRKQIWNETGWFQGADNKWRFEVPDDQLRVDVDAARDALPDPNAAYDASLERTRGRSDEERVQFALRAMNRAKEKTVLAPDVMTHPALAAGYPGVEGIGVGREWNRGLNGSWLEGQGTLRLNLRNDPADVRSTAAHELQHFVQGQEGFARGGMTGTVGAMEVLNTKPEFLAIEQQIADLQARKAAIAEGLFAKGSSPVRDPEWLKINEQVKELISSREAMRNAAPYEGYRRLAGEVEARNVQTRLDMTPGQRREYAPWETEDVPREDQFVIWGGDQSQGALGEPSQLNYPRNPTLEEMQRFGEVQNVPLSQARTGNALDWERNRRGDYADPLLEGYADKPVAVRLENGEYILLDGNHRASLAQQQGAQELPMYVIPAKRYDPANAGLAPAPSRISDDELAALLKEFGQ